MWVASAVEICISLIWAFVVWVASVNNLHLLDSVVRVKGTHTVYNTSAGLKYCM